MCLSAMLRVRRLSLACPDVSGSKRTPTSVSFNSDKSGLRERGSETSLFLLLPLFPAKTKKPPCGGFELLQFFNSCGFTAQFAQVIQLGPAHLPAAF